MEAWLNNRLKKTMRIAKRMTAQASSKANKRASGQAGGQKNVDWAWGPQRGVGGQANEQVWFQGARDWGRSNSVGWPTACWRAFAASKCVCGSAWGLQKAMAGGPPVVEACAER